MAGVLKTPILPPQAGCCPQTCGWGRLPLCLQGPLHQPRPQQHKGVSSVRLMCPSSPDSRWGRACVAPWKSKSPAPGGPRCSPQISDSSRPKATARASPGPPEMRCPFCPPLTGMSHTPHISSQDQRELHADGDFEAANRADSARLAPLCSMGNPAGSRQRKSRIGKAVSPTQLKG